MSSLKLLMLVKLTVAFGVRWKREEKLKENKGFDRYIKNSGFFNLSDDSV